MEEKGRRQEKGEGWKKLRNSGRKHEVTFRGSEVKMMARMEGGRK